MTENRLKVLVTDCWTRKGISIVRSLGEKGHIVHAASHQLISPAFYSKFVSKKILTENPDDKPSEYHSRLIEYVKKHNYDVIIPLEESTIEVLLENRTEYEKYSSIPLSKKNSYFSAKDKWETMKRAEQLGVPIPKTFLPKNESELLEAVEKIGLPVILKPTNSSGSRGIQKIYDKEQITEKWLSTVDKYGFPLVQELIDFKGAGLGVGCLYNHGKLITNYSYKRLREFPVKGGPSTLRETTNNQEIKEYSTKLLNSLEWNGVAMVEFKIDLKNNTPKLMEINPRFWGSIELAHSAGLNLPDLLVKSALQLDIESVAYKIGVKCRWLIPGDIVHFISNSDRFILKPSFFNFFDKNTFYDQIKVNDIRGTVAVIICSFLSIFKWSTWKMGIFRS